VLRTVEPASLDDLREAVGAEVARIVAGIKSSEDDVRPFLLIGNREGVLEMTPTFPHDISLSFGEQLGMFIEEIVPMVLTQHHAHCAALVVTVWMAPGHADGSGPAPSEHPERHEAVTVALADAGGEQQTLMANVTRQRFKCPTVSEFRVLSDRVQPQIDAAFRRGFLGFG
jgi:hypothetical protein